MKQLQNGTASVLEQLPKYSEWIYNALCFIIIILIVFFHSYKLDKIPLGLFFDESTIGVHASNLTLTGLDAYNGEIPLFFKSDADYDSPILIYTTAAFFKLFGVSEFTLRLPNVLFFSIALLLTFLLTLKIYGNNKLLLIYFLVAFGFLPQFFTLSRLSFEVISQLAAISGAFLCIWWTFHEQSHSKINKYGKAIITGFLIGISTYTYSTANLLSVLLMGSLIAFYFNYKNLKVLAILTVSYLVTLIPYGIFSISNPGALTSRFQNISFIFESIPLIEKMRTFLENY
ncbi:MAG: glycosyltransferase family 39 protein, partial [Anaerolineales bacterium]|nr:glycosyltransferase family 39 protein [Anaerolineales bacterium]